MKIPERHLGICLLLGVVICFANAHTTVAEEDNTKLPGWRLTLEKALLIDTDFIAVAKLLQLGASDPPRFTPGIDVYENVEFEITRVLKGNVSGTVKCWLAMDLVQPPGSKGLRENVKYIIFCKAAKSGILVAGKLLPDDEKTERAITSAR